MRLFLGAFLAISCAILNSAFAFSQDFTGRKIVKIEYKNNIHGYHVKALWVPSVFPLYGDDLVVGPAIVEFTVVKSGTKFTVVNNHFTVLKKDLPFKFKCKRGASNEHCEDEILSMPSDEIKLVYKEPVISLGNGEDFGTNDVPFFFKDVNFDGKDELIFLEARNGQRWGDSFKVYQLDPDDGIQMDIYQITNEEPFKSFDSWITIDNKKKEIHTVSHGGACDSNYYTYSYNESKKHSDGGPIRLSHITETTTETGRCRTLEYEIVDGVRHLISVISD